jgi:hypothetical protein
MKVDLDISLLKKNLKRFLALLNSYRALLFFFVLTALYGYLVWRINVLSSAPPSQADLNAAKQNVTQPHISSATVKKLESLQDNSVRVQALFNEARQNPFQE